MPINSQLVSIIIPCHNQGEFLNDTLESIQQQEYQNFECLLINDGSIDNSEAIGLKWQNEDSRFKYFEQKNKGVSAARNLGLNQAKGDFIQFLDADDIISKDKLSSSLKFLDNDESLDVVISNFSMFTGGIRNKTDPYCDLGAIKFSLESFLFQWQISFSLPIHCPLMRTRAVKSSRFDEELSAQEDWLFWVSIFKTNPKTAFINKTMAYYRNNPNGRTTRDYYEDQLLFTEKIKSYVNQDLYENFLKHRMFMYYEDVQKFKSKIRELENSRLYKLFKIYGRIMKKIRLKFEVNSIKTKAI